MINSHLFSKFIVFQAFTKLNRLLYFNIDMLTKDGISNCHFATGISETFRAYSNSATSLDFCSTTCS